MPVFETRQHTLLLCWTGIVGLAAWFWPFIQDQSFPSYQPTHQNWQNISLILHNATIWTGDDQVPEARGCAVQANGQIAAVGGTAEMLLLQQQATTVTDLQGAFVMPGLIDAHVHLLGGGQTLSWVDLRHADSRAAVAEAVEAAVAQAPSSQWVMGHGWEETHWGGALPDADWIDGVSPVNAVLLYRMDVHMVLINTAALRLAGIDSTTEVPEGGKVVLGDSNEPTGILVDNAIALVTSHIPSLSLDGKIQALKVAVNHLVTKGITTVCDMGSIGEVEEVWEALEQVYMPAADKGELPIRVFAMVPLATWPRLQQLVKAKGRAHPGGHLHWGGLKAFADGSLGSRTALMREPYADDPTTRGIRLTPYSELEQLVLAADAAELQIAIHAIGDQANDDVLAMYSHVQSNNSRLSSPRRHRIEHVQHVSGPDAIAALSQQQTVAVVNPLHLLSDMHIMTDRLGKQRGSAERAFAYNAMLKAGVHLAFASDWPVVPIDPLLGMYVAVHRRSPDMPASQAWHVEGAVTLEQAMMAHTKGAAFACGLEGALGVIRPGMQADFTVLDGNLLDVLHRGPNEMPTVKATYVRGQLQYDSAQAPSDLSG
ncbi:hypothetical protein WJX77_007862 [Trebouxia sp. C0004]